MKCAAPGDERADLSVVQKWPQPVSQHITGDDELIDLQPERTEKSTYRVTVGGISLQLKSGHDHATVQQLAALVDQKVQEAQQQKPDIGFQSALLLGALHLAEELVFLKRRWDTELNQIEIMAKDILSDLESAPVEALIR